VTSKSFKGGEINAFMGGCELDLRDADIEGEVEINVFALMGGIQIAVPPDWNVNARVTPFMGGMEDKTRSSERSPDKRLTLSGFVMMGGIEVTN
jgi:predicted membrane protein